MDVDAVFDTGGMEGGLGGMSGWILRWSKM